MAAKDEYTVIIKDKNGNVLIDEKMVGFSYSANANLREVQSITTMRPPIRYSVGTHFDFSGYVPNPDIDKDYEQAMKNAGVLDG